MSTWADLEAGAILTAADMLSTVDFPSHFFAVPNHRIGTEVGPGDSAKRLVDIPDKATIGHVSSDQPAKALTYDDGKAPLASLPPAGIRAVARVQAYGKKKYGDDENYRRGMEAKRQMSCALRHIYAWLEREDLDKESGESHLAHAACRLLFALQNIHENTLIDDRYKKPQP